MPPTTPRRLFLRSGLALAAMPLAACSPGLRDVRATQLADALQELQRLSQAPQLQSATAWSFGKTLAHLAQSIEYSMHGYPQAKSALFQQALGQPALAFFQWRGRMQHDLTEPIPGSPALAQDIALPTAQQRLLQACQAFSQWKGPLQPHFAYGALTHAEYETAHAMHLANHFAAFEVQSKE